MSLRLTNLRAPVEVSETELPDEKLVDDPDESLDDDEPDDEDDESDELGDSQHPSPSWTTSHFWLSGNHLAQPYVPA